MAIGPPLCSIWCRPLWPRVYWRDIRAEPLHLGTRPPDPDLHQPGSLALGQVLGSAGVSVLGLGLLEIRESKSNNLLVQFTSIIIQIQLFKITTQMWIYMVILQQAFWKGCLVNQPCLLNDDAFPISLFLYRIVIHIYLYKLLLLRKGYCVLLHWLIALHEFHCTYGLIDIHVWKLV